MNNGTCADTDCGKPKVKRDWCNIHYNRLMRAGAIQPLPKLTLEERLWAKVDKSGDCWEWTGCRDDDGYGKILITKNGKSQSTVAHRLAYILTHGEVAPDVKIDHRCHNHGCVNLAHLRATTHKQNLENREGAQRNNTTSGIRGVCWNKRQGKWVGQLKHAGKVIHIGYFTDLREAEAAVIAKRNELFTHNDVDRRTLAAGNA
jgi:hypothetical protein